MGRFNLLGGQSDLLGGQMPTQLTCYLPPCFKHLFNRISPLYKPWPRSTFTKYCIFVRGSFFIKVFCLTFTHDNIANVCSQKLKWFDVELWKFCCIFLYLVLETLAIIEVIFKACLAKNFKNMKLIKESDKTFPGYMYLDGFGKFLKPPFFVSLLKRRPKRQFLLISQKYSCKPKI